MAALPPRGPWPACHLEIPVVRTPFRLALAAAVLVSAASLPGCDTGGATTPARYPLTLNLNGMAPHVGQAFHVRVVHVASNHEITRATVNPVTDPVLFTVFMPDILIAGETYNVDFFADNNNNGLYDTFPIDHTWRRTITAAPGGTIIDFMHDTNWVDIQFPNP
jgi:hypothetical protein